MSVRAKPAPDAPTGPNQAAPKPEQIEAEAAAARARTDKERDAAAKAWLAAAEKGKAAQEQAVEASPEAAQDPAAAQPTAKKRRRVHRRLGPRCANAQCDKRIPRNVQARYRCDLCPRCAREGLQATKASPEAKEWFRGWAAREYTGSAQVREPATVKLANGRTVKAKRASGAPLEPTGESLVDGALRQAGVERRVSAREAGLCRRGMAGSTRRRKR